MKKPGILLLVLAGGCFTGVRANAELRDAIISWTGDGGYSARITMSYDDSFTSVGAWGGGAPISGTPTNQGISQLSVEFFNPSLQPIYSTNEISNYSISYRFLSVSFDTDTKTLLGSLDVGKDSFAEGEPGSSAGQYYLKGVSSPSLVDSFLAQAVDSGGLFTVTVIPEPSTLSLCVVAMVLLSVIRRHSCCT